MTKKEIKTASNSEIIVAYINAYTLLNLNYNLNRGTKQLETECKNLEAELIERGILTEEQIQRLNM